MSITMQVRSKAMLRPRPTSNTPLGPFCFREPSTNFTGRAADLRNIERAFQKIRDGTTTQLILTNTIVISGSGGVGKSEIVRYFIYKNCRAFYKNIIWLDAETQFSLRSCFTTLAEKGLDIPLTDKEGKREDFDLILDAVYRRLCASPTLLIFDNAESYEDFAGSSHGIRPFLPSAIQSPGIHPTILVTTRNLSGWDPASHKITLDVFDDQDCKEYLSRELQDITDYDSQWRNLAKFCENLPIKLEVSVGVIKREYKCYNLQDKNYTVNKFLAECQQVPAGQGLVTNCKLTALWRRTFDQLRRAYNYGKISLQILDLLSFLPPSGVPTSMLLVLLEISGVKSEHGLSALDLLVSLSLLKKTGPNFVASQLLSEARLAALEQQTQLVQQAAQLAQMLLKLITEKTGVEERKVYLQHSAHFVTNFHELLQNSSVYALGIQTSVQLKAYSLQESIHVMETVHNFIATSSSSSNGKLEEVTFLLAKLNKKKNPERTLHLLASLESKLPDYSNNSFNPSFLLKLKQLQAETLHLLGRFLEAEKIFESILANPRLSLTESQIQDIAQSEGNLYLSMGRFQSCRIKYALLLENRRAELGLNHKSTKKAQKMLATSLEKCGNYSEALKLYREVYDYESEYFGPEHPSAMSTNSRIGNNLYLLGDFDASMKILHQTYEMQNSCLGDTHVSTLSTRACIGNVEEALGHSQDALTIFMDVYKRQRSLLGEDHPSTLATLHYAAQVRYAQCHYKASRTIQRQVYEKQSQILGENHPDTLASLHLLAKFDLQDGKYRAALTSFEKVLQAYSNPLILGPDHPANFVVVMDIAALRCAQQDYVESKKLYDSARDKFEVLFGKTHPSTLKSLQGSVYVQYKLREYDAALERVVSTHELQLEVLGPTHPDTLMTCQYKADIFYKQGKYNDAKKLYEQVYDDRCKVLGSHHPHTLVAKNCKNQIKVLFNFNINLKFSRLIHCKCVSANENQ